MATERDLELLDDYLANRMQGADKSAFENKIQADPGLKSEMAMQQRLIKSIKDARVAELKTMLNNTPVPAVNYSTTSAVKLAAGSIVAGLIATGVYLYLDYKPEDTVKKEEQTITTDTQSQEIVAAGESAENPVVAATESTETTVNESTSSTAAKTEKESSSSPEIEVYDPMAENDIEEPAEERKAPSRAGTPSLKVFVESDNSKYDFNYQFREGRLFLFGPFERNLYEILEFFDGDKRTVFLYYKNTYYLLKDDSETVQELDAVKDQALIKKLKEYQKQK